MDALGQEAAVHGGEFGQWREWIDPSLDWHLLEEPDHRGVQVAGTRANNAISKRLYRAEPALWEAYIELKYFQCIDANNADENIIFFLYTHRAGVGPSHRMRV